MKAEWEIFSTIICIIKQLNLYLLSCDHNQKLLTDVYKAYIRCLSVTNQFYLTKGQESLQFMVTATETVFSCRVATDPSLSNTHCNNQSTTQSYFLNNIRLRRWMSHSQQNAGTSLSVCTYPGFSSQSHSTRHGVKIKLLYFR
jgi:hypothetical protein